jgi:hypothetical protein
MYICLSFHLCILPFVYVSVLDIVSPPKLCGGFYPTFLKQANAISMLSVCL